MGLPEIASYASSASDGHKASDAFGMPSEFESTLEKLSPHLLARLSLHPARAESPGTPGSSSSGAGTPSETASSGGRHLGSSQNRRRRNRSWAKQSPLPDVLRPPGLTPPSRSSVGSLPSPPYSADVDRAFRQRPNPAVKNYGRPRSAESTPGSTPSKGVLPRRRAHESSPPSGGPVQRFNPPGSQPRPPSSQRQIRPQQQQQLPAPRKLLLSEAGQRLLRAGQRAGSDAGSEEGSPLQTHAKEIYTTAAEANARPGSKTASAASTPSKECSEPQPAAGEQQGGMSPRVEIRASAGPCAEEASATAGSAPQQEENAAESNDEEAQRRLKRLRAEKQLADDLAAQMALQAQALVAERADMAARNAELARENAQLMARLEFLEVSRGVASGGGEGGNATDDVAQQQQLEEELGFLHDLLQRAEEEKALLEWQLQQRATNVIKLGYPAGQGSAG